MLRLDLLNLQIKENSNTVRSCNNKKNKRWAAVNPNPTQLTQLITIHSNTP